MKKIYAISSLFFTGLATAHNGNDGWVDSKNFQLWSNTYEQATLRIIPTDGVYNPANCGDPDSYMVWEQHPENVKQRIYSALLGAAFAEKSVRLRIDPSSCEQDRPKIIHVIVQ